MPSPRYISREDLCAFILQPVDERPKMAIVDVRDDDHVGGHIISSTHVPSTSLDYKIPELVHTLKNLEIVVFHCALSQQRGPAAARRYTRERTKVLERDLEIFKSENKEEDALDEKQAGRKLVDNQTVYILDGGFVKWQQKYGHDERLTEAYAPDIWVDYY